MTAHSWGLSQRPKTLSLLHVISQPPFSLLYNAALKTELNLLGITKTLPFILDCDEGISYANIKKSQSLSEYFKKIKVSSNLYEG